MGSLRTVVADRPLRRLPSPYAGVGIEPEQLAVLRVLHLGLDLARDLEAAPGRVDGAERRAKNFVDQRTPAEPSDPSAQKSQDLRVVAAGVLLNNVQNVAIVLYMAFAIRCWAEYSTGICKSLDRNLLKTHQQSPLDALPAANASHTVVLPSRCQYGKKHRRFAPQSDWGSCDGRHTAKPANAAVRYNAA